MINFNNLYKFVNFIKQNDGIGNKNKLEQMIKNQFELILDRKIYYCNDFAVRFSQSTTHSFGNTVLSLSALQKYDNRPVIVCVVLPNENYLLLCNTTCLKKISHSSQELRIDNIKGSFNGSDILRNIAGIDNSPKNFERLFTIHQEYGFNTIIMSYINFGEYVTLEECINECKYIAEQLKKREIE